MGGEGVATQESSQVVNPYGGETPGQGIGYEPRSLVEGGTGFDVASPEWGHTVRAPALLRRRYGVIQAPGRPSARTKRAREIDPFAGVIDGRAPHDHPDSVG